MKTLRYVLVLIFFSFIYIETAGAGISYPVTFLNLGYGEGSDRATVSGSLAYTVGSYGFQVYDVSDPVAPTRLYTGDPRWNQQSP